jgi:N-acyl-L-homoserine lactone synthetase
MDMTLPPGLKPHPQLVRTLSPTGFNPLFPAFRKSERRIHGTDLSFRLITSEEDMEVVFRHRFDVFCLEKQVIPESECPGGVEFDEYDGNSVHTAIIDNGKIVAYTRLVLPCNAFPVELSTNLPEDRFTRGKSIETSRALIPKEFRRDEAGKKYIWHLFNSIYRLCQECGIESIVSFSNMMMYNGYKKRNVPFRFTGNPQFYHGHKTVPLIIDIQPNIDPKFGLESVH